VIDAGVLDVDALVCCGIGALAIVMAMVLAGMVWVSDRRLFPYVLTGIVAVMAIQWTAAASGLLRQWQRTPPVIGPLMLITFVLTALLAFSRTGDALIRKFSLSAIVGIQVFRLPLELVMHRAAVHGIMPVQMSYSGYNFDILTGALALPVAWLAYRGIGSRWVVAGWNFMGSCLLATIVAIAVASIPPIAAFGPHNLNTWVAEPPYVWLPGVLVPCALFGHLLVWRSLAADRSPVPMAMEAIR
jgi:hypothetical protein